MNKAVAPHELSNTIPKEVLQKGRKVVGIDGKWYDVTDFIARHPGGPTLIDQFVNHDASEVFHIMHGRKVLNWVGKPVGQYQLTLGAEEDKISAEFRELESWFRKNGYFETSYIWYAKKFFVAFAIWASIWFAAVSTNVYVRFLGGLLLACFWQQSGFFMHDFMHNQGTHNRKIDRWLGLFFGTVCFGISAHWWKEEHFEHHAFTNTIDRKSLYKDPQMQEVVWCQNERLFPLHKGFFARLFIKLQKFTWAPLTVFGGRTGIMVDSWKGEYRVYEWLGLVTHLAWLGLLLSLLPDNHERVIFYLIGQTYQGILSIQLLISHYAKPWYYKEEEYHTSSWYRTQIECNINIKNPVWLDWFHGGLNLHVEHHLYPLMPRHNFRAASVHIKRKCKELGLHYDEVGWFVAVVRTIKHFGRVSKKYETDPCPPEPLIEKQRWSKKDSELQMST